MLEMLCNTCKVKFEYMDNLGVYSNIKHHINTKIFINLDMVIKKIFTDDVETEIRSMNKNDAALLILSNIINIAQHYRLYFLQYKQECEVYLYRNYPYGTYENMDINNRYREDYFFNVYQNINYTGIRKAIDKGEEVLEIIIKYIENVYLCNTSSFDSSIIPYIIYRNKSKDCNWIIVSNDKYDYQYINYGFSIIHPKGKNSMLINSKNVFSKKIEEFNTGMMSFILSCIGIKGRNIPNIKKGYGISRITKLISKAIDNHEINSNTDNIDLLISILPDEIQQIAYDNYKTIDVNYQYELLSESDKLHISLNEVNSFDRNAMNMINERYFLRYPIMII